ncbi:MAG: hypothetical protein HC849_33195, partial [Oscillatoriales cyanobacterium RU_3_3]|nr:hypothetical protein [Oscillatoriales cyanobacterium RU_3_3]
IDSDRAIPELQQILGRDMTMPCPWGKVRSASVIHKPATCCKLFPIIAVATPVKTYRSSTKLNVQSFQSRSLVTADG